MNLDEIFERVIPEPNSGCWLWEGSVTNRGYASATRNRKSVCVHRASYEAAFGNIPEGLCIDHKCRVRCCVNPDHLEAVTFRENSLRGFGPAGIHARKTHCLNGHEFSEENTYSWRRYRQCRECHRIRRRKRPS